MNNTPLYDTQLLSFWGRCAEKIVESNRWSIIKSSDTNLLYCPDLFDENKCPKRHTDEYHISQICVLFPGVRLLTEEDWCLFEITPTFFIGATAPSNLEDTYGELYTNRQYIYILVSPGFPDNLNFFSSEELISSFVSHQSFVNPKSTQNDKFTSLQINRLSALLYQEKQDESLHDIICDIKMKHGNILIEMTELSKISGFKECLIKILEIGMMMRGWDGKDSYPLEARDTSGKVDEDLILEKLLELIDRIDNEWKFFGNIYLIKYDRGDLSFDQYCPYLIDRLKIVLDSENVLSCIRLNSNIFTATAWYYSNHFYNEPPFTLSSLSYIS